MKDAYILFLKENKEILGIFSTKKKAELAIKEAIKILSIDTFPDLKKNNFKILKYGIDNLYVLAWRNHEKINRQKDSYLFQ